MKRIYLYGENSNFNDYDILITDINELDCYENDHDIYLIVNDFYEFSKYNGDLKRIWLKLCKVKINDEEAKPLEIDMDRGLIALGDISWSANTGSDLNIDNYVKFELIIGPLPTNLKSELKGIILDVEYES